MNASSGRDYDGLHEFAPVRGGFAMSADQLRLVLGLAAAIAALAYLASVDPMLMVIVVFLGIVGVGLWLCYRTIRWAWRRFS